MHKFMLPQDKANHFVVGFIIFVIVNLLLSNLFSLILVALIAICKECYDEWDYNGFSFVDIIFTIVPGIILVIIDNINRL